MKELHKVVSDQQDSDGDFGILLDFIGLVADPKQDQSNDHITSNNADYMREAKQYKRLHIIPLICDQNSDVWNDNNDCESKSHLFVKIFYNLLLLIQ